MKIKKIAVTGGLSSGKSTVCQFFKEFGAYVVSADEIVHRLLTPETTIGQQVINLFGTSILTHEQIDRSKIAKLVFDNPKLLQALEHLLHPIVRQEIEKEYQLSRAAYPLFIAEIPLLFETGADEGYTTIAVIADEEKCRQRFVKSKGVNAKDYQQRASRQLSAEEKAAKATYVIVNNCSLDELRETVGKLYQLLISS